MDEVATADAAGDVAKARETHYRGAARPRTEVPSSRSFDASTEKQDRRMSRPVADAAARKTAAAPDRMQEAPDILETEYRSSEPSDIEVQNLIAKCFLSETSPAFIALQTVEAAVTAPRIEAMSVPQGWKTLPSDPLTNRDEIPVVLKLRQIFSRYGHLRVDELWFLRVNFTRSSAYDALERARSVHDDAARLIESDIESLEAEVRRQRLLLST
jgi:hypothetical protein